jgi:hypothetical protein
MYHGYDLKDGKFRHTGSCELGTMIQWADRKATTEEISRLHRDEQETSTQASGMFEGRRRPLREALRLTKG